MWIILAAAIVPGILLLYYVYSKDFNPEPKRMIYKGFFYGCLSVFASTLISGPLMKLGLFVNQPSSFAEALQTSFFGAAIPEESAKLLMLWLLLRHSPEFDERFDGMVYAAAVGLGFACLENLMYVVSAGAGWFQVSVTRAIFAVPGHFAFAIVMGYYFSRNHFDSRKITEFDRIKVWLFPVLLHGIYDTLAFSAELSPAYSGLITILLIWFCYRLFKSTRDRILREAEQNRQQSIHNIDDQYNQ
ncbi:MAG: PrsW family intramembrane metalloprotease [Bacteroidales bacterium]|nr:PrsW family intramembrane metalloprotease [Bacteroidales bacterium]